ncbi:MAG: valine--tRNA ligase, partial [Acidobacteriota bacterium]|nr:valine--tRNA ligase [Acidobacteriota bacterium]
FPQDRKILKGVIGSFAIPVEEGLVNFENERQRLEKELLKVKREIEKIEKRLQNENFLSQAPEDIVKEARDNLHNLEKKKKKLRENLDHILLLI